MTHYTLTIALLCCALPLGARADEYRERVDVVPGGTLAIDLAAGSVEVETGDDDEVRVEARATGFGAGAVRFRLSSDGRDATFVGSSGGWTLGILGGPRIRVVARVPERYSVRVETGGGKIEIEEIDGEIDARTSGGGIAVDGTTGDVRLRTSGGRIQAENIEGDLDARTSGGEIRVSDVKGSVEVKTSGGRIQIDGAGGLVRAATSGGSISVRFDGLPEGSIQTSGGGIDVEIPEGVGIDLDAQTSGGRVVVRAEVMPSSLISRSQLKGSINGGGPPLLLRTSGGNISVEER